MALQIINNGASIRLVGEYGEKLVMKYRIVQVVVIRGETIRIEMDDTLKSIVFRYSDVTNPSTNDASHLAAVINGMITSCVCCDCTTGGPME